jgi:hypothetical protein
MISSSSPKVGLILTKLPRCESSKKCDNTEFKGDQFEDERTLLAVRDLRYEDVESMSNLEMIPEPVLHSLMQLEAL